ncbi:MAG: hypothetical protein QM661_04685 [Solimonas sp.]
MATLSAAAGTAPLPVVSLPEAGVFPESITSTADGSLIWGSLGGGTIYRTAPDQDLAKPWIRADASGHSVYGVLADEARDALWACWVLRGNDGAQSDLRRFSLKNGELLQSYAFPGGGSCNDVAIAPNGTVYATDMSGGRILRLLPGARTLDVWLANERLKGVDGIVAFEAVVYANNFRSNELYAFRRKAPELTVLTASRPLYKPDGMRPEKNGGFLLVEGSGVLSRVKVSGDRAQIDTLYEGLEGTTALAVARGRIWVLDSMFRYRSNTDFDAGPFKAYGVPLVK